MNSLIANQYGRVQGEAGGCGLTLCVTAQTPRRRCRMPNEGNGLTHYVVCNEILLGGACIIEKRNEWILLAFIKFGIVRPDAVSHDAFVENHLLIRKTPN